MNWSFWPVWSWYIGPSGQFISDVLARHENQSRNRSSKAWNRNSKSKPEIETRNRNFEIEYMYLEIRFRVLNSVFKLEFPMRVSNSSFDFELRFRVSMSSFDFRVWSWCTRPSASLCMIQYHWYWPFRPVLSSCTGPRASLCIMYWPSGLSGTLKFCGSRFLGSAKLKIATFFSVF